MCTILLLEPSQGRAQLLGWQVTGPQQPWGGGSGLVQVPNRVGVEGAAWMVVRKAGPEAGGPERQAWGLG